MAESDIFSLSKDSIYVFLKQNHYKIKQSCDTGGKTIFLVQQKF